MAAKRTIGNLVDDIINSKRFYMAMEAFFKGELSYLRAFLIESHFYVQEKTRETDRRAYSSHYGLPKRDMLQHLKGYTDYDNYNDFSINFTKDEQEMLLADLEGNKEKYARHMANVMKKLMG